MRGLLKIALFMATVLSPVYAQNASSPDLSPPIRSAIDRIIKGDAAASGPVVRHNPPPAALLSSAQICSVPLLEMHVDKPEQFSMRTIPPPATGDPMPRTNGPAPPCVQAAPSAPTKLRP
ncbi:MAG: hypothetical protein ABSG13_06170 [Bryobacteraceae bacterium]|jgi:hypothetical protein